MAPGTRTPWIRRAIAVAGVAIVLFSTPTALATGGSAGKPTPFLTGLEFPTNMAFAPDGRLFFTEKSTGRVRIVRRDGQLAPLAFVTLPVIPDAERGLLGIALDPDFDRNPWVYLYESDATSGMNELIRIRDEGGVAGQRQVLLVGLSASSGYHNGGDLAFGLDGTLFASIGEVHESERAQDVEDLGGKIVRMNPDGSVPDDDPFGPTNPVWSYGHRNSFGLCVDPDTGDLWETENGPDVDDEVNLIRAGANYGWPLVTGKAGGAALTRPVVAFHDTIALTGCAVVDGDLYFGAFDGTLWRLASQDRGSGHVTRVATFPSGVTDVLLGPDGVLYVATSDAIWTLEPESGNAHASAPAASPSGPTNTASAATGTDQDTDAGSGRPAWLAAAAAAVIVVGLGFRFAAGRRLRREVGGGANDAHRRGPG
jgi:glucose/arabinose dehydrogenase